MDDENEFSEKRNKLLMNYLLKTDVTEKKFEEIIEKCSNSKTKYVDPDFYPQKEVTIDKPVLKEHQWKRIEDYYPNLFDNITQDSIAQGELGDCYFICALIYIAKDKDLVKTIFHPKSSLEYGCVLVYFQFMGVKLPVIVDTQMPFDLENSGYDPTIPKFSRPKAKEDPCWFVLLEKAFAKLCGSYKAIISGTTSYGVRILMEYFSIYIDDFKSFLPPSAFNQDNNKFDFNKEVFNEISRLHKKNAML